MLSSGSRAAQKRLEVYLHLLPRFFQPVEKVGSEIGHHLTSSISVFRRQFSQG